MASYNGMSHYSHEVTENYIDGWNNIFGKKENKEEVKQDPPTEVTPIRAEDSLP